MRLQIKIQDKNLKGLLTNFLSASFLQLINYFLPLLLIPFLVRVLGAEKFGLISLAQATSNFLIFFTDYGFNLSATRELAIKKNNPEKVNEIFTTVSIIKIILLIITFLVFFILIISFPKFKADAIVYLFSFTIVIGQTFFPLWFFQGIEKLKYVTYLTAAFKVLTVIFTFVYIESEMDFIYVNLISGVCSIGLSLAALILLYKKFNIRFVKVNYSHIKLQLKEGWETFLSTFSSNIYITSNTIILGLFFNNTIVGFYSIAEKVILGVRQLLGIIFQVSYPYVCRLASSSHKEVKQMLKKIFFLLAISFTIIGVGTFYFADLIVVAISGTPIPESISILKLLSFVPLIVALNIPAYQTLLAYQFKNSYLSVLVSGSILNILLNILLARVYAGMGTAVSVLVTEIFVTISLYFILEIKHSRYSLVNFVEYGFVYRKRT